MEFTQEALTEIAKRALNRKMGARGLRAIIEHTISGRRVHNSDSDYRLSYVLNTGVNFLEEQRLGLSFS